MTPEQRAAVVRAMAIETRRNRFVRTRRTVFDETVPPTENELDDARAALDAALTAMAAKGIRLVDSMPAPFPAALRQPHSKYPWFCKDCGYPEHEKLKHL